MLARYYESIDLTFWPTATLAALYVNAHLPQNHRPVSAEEFIPRLVAQKAEVTKYFKREREKALKDAKAKKNAN